MPDSNDPPLAKKTETDVQPERGKLPVTPKRFFRGLSHDVGRRGGLRIQHIIAAIVIVAGGTWAAIEIHERMTHVYEYDARIDGNLITISSRVAGWVTKIAVTEGQMVKQDQVLIQIDSRESELQVVELQAQALRVQAERERKSPPPRPPRSRSNRS